MNTNSNLTLQAFPQVGSSSSKAPTASSENNQQPHKPLPTIAPTVAGRDHTYIEKDRTTMYTPAQTLPMYPVPQNLANPPMGMMFPRPDMYQGAASGDLAALHQQYNQLLMATYGGAAPLEASALGKQRSQMYMLPPNTMFTSPAVAPSYNLLDASMRHPSAKGAFPVKTFELPVGTKTTLPTPQSANAILKPIGRRKRSQVGRRRRSNEWKKEEVILLLQCTKLLIHCELKTISQALFSCIKRSPGKCWGRAAEKKLKRMKIFVNWKTCNKEEVLESIDEHLRKLGALNLPIPDHVEKVAKRLEAVEKSTENQPTKKIL